MQLLVHYDSVLNMRLFAIDSCILDVHSYTKQLDGSCSLKQSYHTICKNPAALLFMDNIIFYKDIRVMYACMQGTKPLLNQQRYC